MESQTKRAPIINAPLPLTALALTLIVLHGLRVFAPEAVSFAALYHGALFPERFWGWTEGQVVVPGGMPPYAGILTALAPLVLSALLHGDWFHVILNAAFLVAIGKPVIDILTVLNGRYGPSVIVTIFILIFASQAAGGLVYLLLNAPDGGIAIGSSGGLSGLLGAYLLMREGGAARLLSRNFLTITCIFAVANVILAVIGPSLLGASIAWEVHLGGYLGGALLGRFLIWNAVRKLDI